jgi:hypothetical protein
MQEAINSLADNRVLGTRPPEVSSKEKELPWIYRSTLCQLRLSYCNISSESLKMTDAHSVTFFLTPPFTSFIAKPNPET